jgi:hypothetical protein
MDTSDLSPEMLQHLKELHARGIDFSKTELWVYKACADTPKTVGQLAELKGVQYQAIQPAIRVLRGHRILQEALSIGREKYWQTFINLEQTSDIRQKFNYRGELLSFEDLVWYLQNPRDLEISTRFIRYGLAHIYRQAMRRKNGEKAIAPTSSEVRSMLMAMSRELEQIIQLLQQIIHNEDLFKPDPNLLDALGEYDTKTRHFIEANADTFFTKHWGQHVTGRGFKKHVITNFNTIAQAGESKREWEDQRG